LRTLAVILLLATTAAAQQGINLAEAEQYFADAQQVCNADAGKLWGVSLCGPLLFADQASRMVVASQADAEGKLQKQGRVFVGSLPPEVGIANTGMDWAGVRWTMLRWPLPAAEVARKRLLAHEMFHRIQPQLGMAMSNPANAHLDSLEGRIWLQMEYRALQTALTSDGEARSRAIADALLFRKKRQAGSAAAAADENALELNEGTAEYTGIALRGPSPAENRAYIAERLKTNQGQSAYARSFAYTTGPAWGLLLDEIASGWRTRLIKAGSFAALVPAAMQPKGDDSAEQRAAAYDYAPLRAAEEKRAKEREALLAAYRRKFVDGPVLVIPVVDNFSFGFDPLGAETLENAGTVYRSFNARDSWGVLDAPGGALMVRNDKGLFTQVILPAPVSAAHSKGEGWELKLAAGWKLVPGKRAGDFTVARGE
jgi:hypothetical protein